MNIATMHWEWKLRFNKINSNHKKDFTPQEIDSFINTASNDLFEILYSGNRIKQYKLGFEVTQQRRDMLSNFAMPEECITAKATDNACNVFEIPFTELSQEYAHLTRAFYRYNCVDKQGRPFCDVISVKTEQHDDLNVILLDSFKKPSFKWRRLVGVIRAASGSLTESSLYVYTDNDLDLTDEEICLEYLRCPRKVYLGRYDGQFQYDGYDTLEYLTTGIGNQAGDPPVDSDWPVKYHDLLVDMAVQEAARQLEDGASFQLKLDKINKVIQ